MPSRRPAALALPALLAALSARGAAQERAGASLTVGAQAIGVVTHASPAFVGRDFTEGYVTQPAVMAHATLLGGHLAFHGTLDFEGLTLQRGELTPGIYGEGYVDRRHPHTYTHELIGVASTEGGSGAARRFAASLAGGKGFAPFGTDDPMSRPFVKFPVNHHLSQILERIVAIGAVRAGPLGLEAGVFNGDEPVGPGTGPVWSRFGDSFAGRVTLAPRAGTPLGRLAGLELQASGAWVESPEFAAGGGSDQRKWSASARAERGIAGEDGHRYLLVEWARTDDVVKGSRAFTLTSLLGEGSLTWRGAELALRLEQSVRPEEERLADQFRSARPHTDASILGRTRWNVATVHAGFPRARVGALRAEPFVEVTGARPAEVTHPAFFEPARFFGSATQWGFSTGLRLALGAQHGRMGRYGVAEAPHVHAARSHDMRDMRDMPEAHGPDTPDTISPRSP